MLVYTELQLSRRCPQRRPWRTDTSDTKYQDDLSVDILATLLGPFKVWHPMSEGPCCHTRPWR